jgi:hypothetical protein
MDAGTGLAVAGRLIPRLLLPLLHLLQLEACRQGNTMPKANLLNKRVASLGWLACVAVAIASNGPAIAQGGASCLFQCDSQCYGQQGARGTGQLQSTGRRGQRQRDSDLVQQ